MPLTLTLAPQPIAWSKNPIPVQLTSDNYLATVGYTASNILEIVGPAVIGHTFSLTWALGKATFTFVATPDNSGTQLPAGPPGSNYLTYVTTLLPYFKANYYLNRDFDITQIINQAAIMLSGKKNGPNYNIIDIFGIIDSDPIWMQKIAGVDTVQNPNFSHLFQVWKKGSPDVQLYSGNLQLDYPVTGITGKEIGEILNTYLDYDVPDLNTIWQPCSKSFMEYYLQFAQSYGAPPTVKGVTQTGSYFVYLGGYSRMALNVISTVNHLQTYLLDDPSHYQTQKWFESFPVDNITLKTNSPAFLYFINNRSVAETLTLKVVMTFDNGPTQTITKTGGLLNPFHKVAINCAYQALGLNGYVGSSRKVISYTVQLYDVLTGDPRSVVKTFNVDHSWEPFTRYILFGDSAGNFKCLRLWGKGQLNSDITDNLANRFPDQSTPALGNINRYDILSTETDGINTGYINAAPDYDNLKELMLAKNAFRIIDGVLIPINITSKKFNYSADGANMNGFKLEYQLAYQEANYTGTSAALKVPQLNRPTPAPAELPSTTTASTGFPLKFPFKLK